MLQIAAAKDFPVDSVIKQKLQHYVEKHQGSPGVVVGIIDSRGERVFTYGQSGNPLNSELSADTRFEIGSISKTLTGTLLADLIISGLVTPDQKLRSLFPSSHVVSNGVEQISLEQLATHTSGLPRIPLDIGSLFKILSTDPYQGSTSEAVLSAATSLPEMLVSVDKSMNYSNLGVALLGRLLEKSVDIPYEKLLTKRVLTPLGLNGIETQHKTNDGQSWAVGHGIGGRPVPYWHVDGYTPAGGLNASMNDMLAYLRVNISAENLAIKEATRKRMKFSSKRGIGLGWMHLEEDGQRLIWHDGVTAGFSSFIGFLPDENRGFVILSNGQGEINALARSLLKLDQPALNEPGESLMGYAITLFLLLYGPLILWQSIQQANETQRFISRESTNSHVDVLGTGTTKDSVKIKKPVDRFDTLRRIISPIVGLILAERLGAWLQVPYEFWWAALATSITLYVCLLIRSKELPWLQKGKLSLIYRISITFFELIILFMLFA